MFTTSSSDAEHCNTARHLYLPFSTAFSAAAVEEGNDKYQEGRVGDAEDNAEHSGPFIILVFNFTHDCQLTGNGNANFKRSQVVEVHEEIPSQGLDSRLAVTEFPAEY